MMWLRQSDSLWYMRWGWLDVSTYLCDTWCDSHFMCLCVYVPMWHLVWIRQSDALWWMRWGWLTYYVHLCYTYYIYLYYILHVYVCMYVYIYVYAYCISIYRQSDSLWWMRWGWLATRRRNWVGYSMLVCGMIYMYTRSLPRVQVSIHDLLGI